MAVHIAVDCGLVTRSESTSGCDQANMFLTKWFR